MTSPRHAFEKDEKGRYYKHPISGTEYPSVTNVLSVGFAKFGLPRWYASNAADYALDNLPEVVRRSRTDRDGIRTEIVEAADRARDSAANLGTRIHALAEAHLLSKPVTEEEGDREAGIYVEQYLKFLKDFGVDLSRDVVASEMTVANTTAGYAGTLDSILALGLDGYLDGKVKAIPAGEPRRRWLIDIKTSRKRAATQTYPEYAIQLAALRHARECWIRLADGTDVVEPMPTGVSGCAVLNLRTHTYKLIPLPAGMREFKVFLNVLEQTRWSHGVWPGEYDHRPVTPAGRFEPKRGGRKAADKGTPEREVA